MKRSKLFLGISTCVLAVAALAATKVSKFTRTVPGYITSSLGICTSFANLPHGYYTLPATGANKVKTTVSKQRVVYSYNASACEHPLYTKGGLN